MGESSPFSLTTNHCKVCLRRQKLFQLWLQQEFNDGHCLLAAHDYQIKFRSGQNNGNADLLSRLPLPESPIKIPDPGETILLMEALDSSVITASQIKTWTAKDPVLAKVKDMLLQGQRPPASDEFKPFRSRFMELSVHDGCILWGNRVVIPPRGCFKMVEQLHESHPGICRMKSLTRSYVWWPNMDQELENRVKTCNICQQNRPADNPVPVHPWEFPKRPWVRLHLDYAGPVQGKMYLVLIDAYSKWLDVKVVSTATSSVTIQHLHTIFATHGLPEVLVTDNGSCFTSQEFKQFTKLIGIRHVCTAPYHPASNGQAERAVKIVKEALRKCSNESLETYLARLLFHYRLTPQTTTGVAPAELLLGRCPRSHLDLAKPDLHQQIESKQSMQAAKAGGRKEKTLGISSEVFVKNFCNGQRWIPGTITQSSGPKSFMIELSDG